MANATLTKSFLAGGAISPYRIVKMGSDDDSVVQGAAATDSLMGVADGLGAESGQRVDVILQGTAEVTYGGSVTRGALLTCDASGRAVAAAPAAGSNVRIIGIALVSGVSGDVATILVNPGSMQG